MSQEPYVPPPTVPPAAGQVDQPPDTPASPPRKNRTTLIIVLIAIVLLLCCCVTGLGAIAAVYISNQNTLTVLDEPYDLDESDSLPPTLNETALDEWYAWEPVLGENEYSLPTSWQQTVAEDVMAELYPELTVLDVYVDPGSWSEEREQYLTDLYFVRASLADDPGVEIGAYFYATSEEALANDALSIDPGDVEEDSELADLGNGVEYIYPTKKPAMHYGMTADVQEALVTVASDWPGVQIEGVAYGNDESTIVLNLSTWDHFLTVREFEGVEATYVRQDGEWALDSYEWMIIEGE